MPTEHFIKLTEQTFGEIIINTSAITFISIDTCQICIRNTDIHGNGMLQLTKESMTKLLHCIDYITRKALSYDLLQPPSHAS